MTDAVTNKTMVLVSRLGDYWITSKQAETLQEHLGDEKGGFTLEGNHIANRSVDGILTADAYNIYNLKKRGGWQCKYQEWHERGQQCAHHLIRSQA